LIEINIIKLCLIYKIYVSRKGERIILNMHNSQDYSKIQRITEKCNVSKVIDQILINNYQKQVLIPLLSEKF